MKATERIGNALALFTATTPERTTSDVARLLGVVNSTAHDLLNGLADSGLLSRKAPGRFRLGPRIAQLAETLHSSDTLIEASRMAVINTAENYGETCHVFKLAGDRMISMTSSEGRGVVLVAKNAMEHGTPLHATAPGKMLMSALPLAELNRLLSRSELSSLTANTVRQKSILRDQITQIREDGYAEEAGEFDSHMASVAAPVKNHSDTIVGVLALLIPASRFAEQRRAYRNICVETARSVSTRLGWNDPNVASAKPVGSAAFFNTEREWHNDR